MYAYMYTRVYTKHLYDDKLNTWHFMQSGRKLKFLRNKRANRRSCGKQMERNSSEELKTTGMVMLDLTESQKLDVGFFLLEPVDRGFFLIRCHN